MLTVEEMLVDSCECAAEGSMEWIFENAIKDCGKVGERKTKPSSSNLPMVTVDPSINSDFRDTSFSSSNKY